MSAPDGPVRRTLRRFTLGSGPLKRRSDRLQVLGRFVVVLTFLVSPPVAVATTNAATTHLERVADAEAAERSRSHAVLLEDARAPDVDLSDDGDYVVSSDRPVLARAAWTVPGPAGTTREGTVVVPPRTPAGTSVEVWVDRDGNLTRPPRSRAGIPGTAAAIGVLPLIGVPLAGWALYAVLCLVLDAHRERRWGQDWAQVEPEWNSRLL
jgi:hypothetical protein